MPSTRSTPPLVHRPVTVHRWEDVVFAHRRHDPSTLARLVPRGTRPDIVDGSAWAGLCAYVFRETSVPPFPAAGRLGTMTEVTIEILTVDDAGRHGVAYRTIDTANVPAIVAAHALLGVPYTFAHARSHRRRDTVAHRSVRSPARPHAAAPIRWAGAARRLVAPRGPVASSGPVASTGPVTSSGPVASSRPGGPAHVRHDATVRVVAGPVDDSPLAAALTTREGIHARHLGQTFFWQRSHPPLTLRSARVERLDGDLPDAVGLPGLFDQVPDSVLVLDGTTVQYAWGGVVR